MRETTEKAFEILGARAQWEQKQRAFYQLRHDGLRRRNKPFPSAADLHFPMIDMVIGDLKPFWVAQAFGGSRLCDFVSLAKDKSATQEAAGDYFDFILRYHTQNRYRTEQMIDTMLLRGRGVLMAATDPFDGWKIKIRAIDPQYILMAEEYDDFTDADHWVWVQHLTVGQYQQDRNYNQDPDVLQMIRGSERAQDNIIRLEKEVREGVTHTSRKNEIVLWHHYIRQQSGGWVVETQCPQALDAEIREPFTVPYELNGEPSCPFHSFTMEIKDEGWYSPRGLAELNAAFEQYACKCWNEESDYMTFGNKPLFTSDDPQQNINNLRFTPGSFIPGNLKAVQMPQPPISFQEKINFVRGLGEQRSRTPDFGQFAPSEKGEQPITATQSRISAGLQAVGADHNGDMFRSVRLIPWYRHLWCLMLHADRCQRDAGQVPTLSYYAANQLNELPEQAMHDNYLLIPAGGSANKQERVQRAGMRMTLLKGHPNIDQAELAREYLEADDARLIPKLYIQTDQKQQTEAFQEDVEIGVLEKGRPVPVLAGQDHVTRILELIGYLHSRAQLGVPPDPVAIQRIQEHMATHFEYLRETQPQVVKPLQAFWAAQMQAITPQNVTALPQEAMQ